MGRSMEWRELCAQLRRGPKLVRKQGEIASVDSMAGGLFSTIELALMKVKTLKIKTERKEYEIWVPQTAEWANRIHERTPELL